MQRFYVQVLRGYRRPILVCVHASDGEAAYYAAVNKLLEVFTLSQLAMSKVLVRQGRV